MSDMYTWIDTVSESMEMPFELGQTVHISKDFGGGLGQVIKFYPAQGKVIVNIKGNEKTFSMEDISSATNPTDSYYVGNTEKQRYDDISHGNHYLPDKPELQPGQLVKIDGACGAGNGELFGVFQSYSLDGQTVLCNIDSKVLSFQVNLVTAAEEMDGSSFGDTGNDGSLSPMSLDSNLKNTDLESRMDDLEQQLQIIHRGRFKKPDAGNYKWNI